MCLGPRYTGVCVHFTFSWLAGHHHLDALRMPPDHSSPSHHHDPLWPSLITTTPVSWHTEVPPHLPQHTRVVQPSREHHVLPINPSRSCSTRGSSESIGRWSWEVRGEPAASVHFQPSLHSEASGLLPIKLLGLTPEAVCRQRMEVWQHQAWAS